MLVGYRVTEIYSDGGKIVALNQEPKQNINYE